MGEASGWLFEPEFNRAIKVCEQDQRITSDAGVLLLREADHRLGLVGSLAEGMVDPRDSENVRYTLVELLRERLYVLAQGYAAQDDVDRLAHDPALRMAVWDRPGERVLEERLASQPTQSRLLDALAACNVGGFRPAGSLPLHRVAASGDHHRPTLTSRKFSNCNPRDNSNRQPPQPTSRPWGKGGRVAFAANFRPLTVLASHHATRQPTSSRIHVTDE